MGVRSGDYSVNLFDPFKRYWTPLLQESAVGAEIPIVDADWNDGWENAIENIRRYRYEVFGDGTPGSDHWEIIQSTVNTTNNFEIDGGGGTIEDACRLYLGGLTAVKEDAIQFDPTHAVAIADEMDYIHHRSTGLTETVLTDLDANYTVNELVGRALTPDVTAAATTYVITANTATTITTAGPMLTGGANPGDYYSVDLTTPAGGDRTDKVYLDVYLDEIDATEDASLLHAGTVEACRRLQVVQQIHVYEGGSYGSLSYTSVAGNVHYRILLATLDRLNGDNTVTTAMITDERPYTPGYGSSQEVIDARSSAAYGVTYTSLDARMEVTDDDAYDAHRFIDEARADGVVQDFAPAAVGIGVSPDVQWNDSVCYVGAERFAVSAATVTIAGGAGTYYVYVDSTGTVVFAGAIPGTGAILAEVDFDGANVTALRDWQFWLNTLDNKGVLTVEPSGHTRANMSDLQAAINYAIRRDFGVIRVKSGTYATTTTIDITTVSGTAADGLHIIFEPNALIKPAGAWTALSLSSAANVIIDGLHIDGTSMAGSSAVSLASCSDIQFNNLDIDGKAAAGAGVLINASTRVFLREYQIYDLTTTAVEVTGICQRIALEYGYLDAVNRGLSATGTIDTLQVNVVQLGSNISQYGLFISTNVQNVQVDWVDSEITSCTSVVYCDSTIGRIDNVTLPAVTCTAGGVAIGANASRVAIRNIDSAGVTGSSTIDVATGDDIKIEDCYLVNTGIAQYPVECDGSDRIVISGVTIVGASSTGMYINNCDYFTIENCTVASTLHRGIEVQDSNYGSIRGCNVYAVDPTGGDARGIHLIHCLAVNVDGNQILVSEVGTNYGIRTSGTGGANQYCSITNNQIVTDDYGIYLGSVSADLYMVVSGNAINDDGGAGGHGIKLHAISFSTISNNTINGLDKSITNTGPVDTSENSITGNVCNNPASNGVYLNSGMDNSIVSDNLIVSAGSFAIMIDALVASNIEVNNNLVDSCAVDGIFVFNSSDINISGNTVRDCTAGAGIKLEGSYRCVVTGNYTTNNLTAAGDGVYLNTCTRCTVTGNQIGANANSGIHLNASDINNVLGNSISQCTNHGIQLVASDHNVISTNECYACIQNGIDLIGTCLFNAIVGNNCSYCSEGIYVPVGNPSNTINSNTCYNNANGIYSFGDYYIVNGNNCQNNTNGIYAGGWNGTITGNGCHSNTSVGILYAGFDCNISGNTAINNAVNDIDTSGAAASQGLGDVGVGFNNVGTYNVYDNIV